MSRIGYARLLLDTDGVASGALIYVLHRDGNNTRFVHRKTNRAHKGNIGDKSLLWFPQAIEILNKLSDLTPVGVMSQRNEGEWWYNIVNMQFGVLEEVEVPVFKAGKRQSKRLVQTTRHVRIRAHTFDQAVYALFFATLGGKLCRRTIKGEFEYLRWDSLEQRFKTEIRKDAK